MALRSGQPNFSKGVISEELVARIDVERMQADDPPNLTSAIRQWLWRARVD